MPENIMTRTAYNLNPIAIPLPLPLPLPSLMLLSVMLAAALVASPRLHAAEAGDPATRRSVIFDCDKRFISQRQAGWLLGIDNFSRTYDRRAALYAEVARACATGVAAVRIEGRKAAVAVAQLSGR
jgi:hypothetical protein